MNQASKIALALAVIVLLIAGFLFFQSKNGGSVFPVLAENAIIDGDIDFNGTAPAGSTITILARESGKGSFQTVVSNLAATDKVSWNWTGAKVNQNYDLIAQLMLSNQVLSTSQTLQVTAPATNEQLSINYAASPQASPVPSASPTTSPQQVRITGFLDLNGYIPTGSTITIEQRVSGQGVFNQVGTPFDGVDGETWFWKEPLAGTTYDIQAVLRSGSTEIGRSQSVTVTAPAANQVLTVNSKATPPPAQPTTAKISGSINFNGVAPQNSSIVILQRVGGTNNYQVVVNGVQPSNGSQWLWGSAVVGTTYEILAVLKQQNSDGTQSDISYSQSLIVSAPAANEVLTINSNASLPPPSQAVTMACGSKNNNVWSVQVNYPTIASAKTYWFQIGTSSSGSELVNTTSVATNNPTQTVNASFNDSVTYYARYAYSYVANASWNSGFSSFSNTYSFKCPQ